MKRRNSTNLQTAAIFLGLAVTHLCMYQLGTLSDTSLALKDHKADKAEIAMLTRMFNTRRVYDTCLIRDIYVVNPKLNSDRVDDLVTRCLGESDMIIRGNK